MECLLTIEIDALSKTYITKELTPFLYNLKNKSPIQNCNTGRFRDKSYIF